MKRAIIATALIASFASTAFAKDQGPIAADLEVRDYHYGMHLDIDRVLQRTDNSRKTGVVPTVVVYRDSQGQVHAVRYLEWGGQTDRNG